MQPNERYDIILQMLASKEMVTIGELLETFDVSIETVRRDLNYLAKAKLIKKVYGGAILFDRSANFVSSGSTRISENYAEKEAIGRACAQLIHDGDTVFLGPGTTVRQVAKYLKNHQKLTVITTSLYVITELMDSDVTLYIVGGKINNLDATIAAPVPNQGWDWIAAPKAIIGVGGISSKYGVTDFSVNESQLLKDMLNNSMNVIVVADNSKFGLVHPCITCSLSRVSRIITGCAQQEDILEDFADYRQRFLFVDDYEPDRPRHLAEEDL